MFKPRTKGSMGTRPSVYGLLFSAFVLTLAQGCHSSGPENGKLLCGTGATACPDGYYCSKATNTCWLKNTGPDAGTPLSVDASMLPDSGDASSLDSVKAHDDGPAVEVSSSAEVSLPDSSLPDSPSPDSLSSDATLADAPTLQPDAPGPQVDTREAPGADAPHDAPTLDASTDTAATCTGACCKDTDCPGPCQSCSASHTCVAATSKDDPSGHCAGTCDTTGACKSKPGQACGTVAGGCASGSTCADGYCCNSACTGSCEACDLAANPGTCTTLSAGSAPHQGHAACTATDTACAGTCNGTSASCAYPATACGTATCTGLVFQPKGACSAGACTMPTTQTCANLCSATAGGCTGVCTPDKLQCSTSNAYVPQKCSASGAWQDQTACNNGFNCSAGACVCATPKSTCGTSCVDVQGTDANNCGSCGHSCLGGTCSAGKCQPATMVSGMGEDPVVLGVDSQYVYYRATPNPGQPVDFSRVGRTVVAGSGTALFTPPEINDRLYGVVGTNLVFKSYNTGNVAVCSIVNPASSTTSCATTFKDVPNTYYGHIIPWRSPSGPDFAYENHQDSGNPLDIFWTSTSLDPVKQVSDSDTSAYYGSFFVAQNLVYWIATSNNVTSLWVANTTNSSNNSKIATGLSNSLGIADANAQSVLLWDANSGDGIIYRLAAGTVASPTQLTSMVTPPSNLLATEDASWVYWFDSSGNLSRCSPSNCASSKTVIATGQQPNAALYQDATALYWGNNTSPAAIIRLAK